MAVIRIFNFLYFICILIILHACAKPLPWPESPLYDFSMYENEPMDESDMDAVKKRLEGHYAHYDVVSYQDSTTKSPMNTFIISYGFTDFFIDSLGNLIQMDRFVRASHKINQKYTTTAFSDKAVQNIKPRQQKVELSYENGRWHIFRPPSPSLLGIEGDPSKPLSGNRNDQHITDPDEDGHPGVTVKINIGGIIRGDIYIIRREIFSNYFTLHADGKLTGFVKDDSEQFVVGASLKILDQASNNVQHPSKGMSPILLVPVPDEVDTLEELMEIRDAIFPEEPGFL